VKLPRALLRTAILSLAATGFIGLTEIYSSSGQPSLPSPEWQAEHRRRPSVPNVSYVSEFLGEGMLLFIFAAVGRVGLRLRLSSPPRNKGRPIMLDLHADASPKRS
jgi:hypothetical protein